jgi:ABC-type antimicrobial peptide transport system permease subunit
VSDNFFPVLSVAPSAGRTLRQIEANSPGKPVAMISEDLRAEFARAFPPLGATLRVNGIVFTIVGVVPQSFTGLDRFIRPSLYLPLAMSQRLSAAAADPLDDRDQHNLIVKGRLHAGALYESRATGTWLQFFPMVGTIGFIGLALATSGVYGLIAYTVSRRVQEFGIRVALGASRRDVVWLVERRGLLLAALGIVLGGVLTAVAVPLLSAGFFGLSASSPVVYTLVPMMLLAVSAAANYLPVRRAAGLDPLQALRNE